jgi:hypothetical protein
MRFDHHKAFPYPVLRPDIDDYVNAEFQVTVDVAGVKENSQIEVRLKVALSSDAIRAQIVKGSAAVSAVVASRLWWMGHLCARVEGMSLKNSLELLLYRADVRANIVERPTTAQSVPVFSALISRLAKSYKGKQKLFERNTFRTLMIRLNGLGGYKLLDALERKAVEQLIDDLIANDLKLSSV